MKHPGSFLSGLLEKIFSPGRKYKTRKRLPLKGDKLAKIMKARFEDYTRESAPEEIQYRAGAKIIDAGKVKVNVLKAVR
jgi:hypothetical protein